MNNNYFQSFFEEVNSAERARRTQRNVSVHSGRYDVDGTSSAAMYDAIPVRLLSRCARKIGVYRPAHESKEKQWAQKLETRQTYRGDRSLHRTLWTAGRNLETRKRRFVKRLRGLRPWRPQLRLLMPNLCRGRGTRRGFRLGTC